MNAQYRFSLIHVLGLLTLAAGVIAIVAACLAMAGWIFGLGVFGPQFSILSDPGRAPLGITPDAALCFILCGISLWVLRESAGRKGETPHANGPSEKFLIETAMTRATLIRVSDEDSDDTWKLSPNDGAGKDEKGFARRFSRRLAQLLASVAAAIAMVVLAGYLLGWDASAAAAAAGAGDGNWLALLGAVGGHWGWQGGFATRMAPSAALAFLLNGVALTMLDVETRRGSRPAQHLALIALLLSLSVALGHAYQTSFYEFIVARGWPEMTALTAVIFVALSIGVVCARPRNGLVSLLTSESIGGSLARRLLPAAIVIPAALGALTLIGRKAGYFDTSFAAPALAAATVLFFMALIWRSAASLHNLDTERTLAEAALYKAYSELQKRVNEQTSELMRANQDLWAEMIERERVEKDLSHSQEELAQHEQSESRLRENAAWFRTMVDTTPVMIWVAGADKVCDFFNRSWLEYTGRTIEKDPAFMENGWAEGVHPEDFERCLEIYADAFNDRREFEVECRLRRTDGDYRWVLVYGAPRFDPDRTHRIDATDGANGADAFDGFDGSIKTFAGYIGSCLDIHERKKYEDELLSREQAVRGQAEEANRLKDEFLATVSHELRAPLNAIQGWVKLLRDGRLNPEESARALETIERSTRAQNRIISDLLDVSRIITGKLSLNVRPIQPAAVIKSAVESLRPAADAKEISIELELDDDAGAISGDSDRLRQIVWNLVSNAIKFTPARGKVRVKLECAGEHIVIAVSDTGVGIAQDFLPFVFDRFRQGDGSSTRRQGGLGIGLAIVRHLTEMHGGSVGVQSPGLDQGATFVVKLPLIAQTQAPHPSHPAHPTHAATLAQSPHTVRAAQVHAGCEAEDSDAVDQTLKLDGLRVLAVDDDQDARDLIRTILTQYGAVVETAGSISQALAVFERPEEWQPELLISDIEMPEADGYQLIRKLRELESQRGRRVPAIALTAYARVEDRLRSLSAGFQMHVTKPVEPAELLTIVASLTGRLKSQPGVYEVNGVIRQEAR